VPGYTAQAYHESITLKISIQSETGFADIQIKKDGGRSYAVIWFGAVLRENFIQTNTRDQMIAGAKGKSPDPVRQGL
jgi:hypothetical protein